MTLQNRVMPDGSIVDDPARGTLTGNRGILHDEARRLGTARWRHPHWISCELTYKGWKRSVMSPGTWTELFFLDEAVALAAGHRPCALCRRADYRRFAEAWAQATGSRARSHEIDRALHAARVESRTRLHATHEDHAESLPDGTFISANAAWWLLLGAQALPFAPDGYGPARDRPTGQVTVLTPAPIVAVLRAGYRPRLHPTAGPART